MYLHGGRVVIAASIGGARVLESPGMATAGDNTVFTRTLNVGAAKKPLLLRVAPDSVNVAIAGDGSLRKDGGFWIAELPGRAKTRLFISRSDLAKIVMGSLDLEPLTHGGPARWSQDVTTTSVAGKTDGAFISDTFPLPTENPWQSWMRPGGFDFTPDGHATKGALSVTFSDRLHAASVKPDAFALKVWSLKRSANYGSKHLDEHPLEITAARLGTDARTVTLDIPALAPTQCYELKVSLQGADGATFARSMHGTIHQLAKK